MASFLSVTNLSHDIAIVPEATKMRGRIHHVCFYYTSVQHLFDVAELAKEAGVGIRTRTSPAWHRGRDNHSTCWSREAIASSSWAIPAIWLWIRHGRPWSGRGLQG